MAHQESQPLIAGRQEGANSMSKPWRTALLLVLVILPVTFSGIRAGIFISAVATSKTCEQNDTVLDDRDQRWSCEASGGQDLSIDAAYAIGKILHLAEFFAFGFYAYKFCRDRKMCKEACSGVWKVLKACEKASLWFWSIVVLFVVPYCMIVIILFYFEVVGEHRDVEGGGYNVPNIYHALMGLPVHFYTVIERFIMMLACLAVHQVWHLEPSQSTDEQDPLQLPQPLNSLLTNPQDSSQQELTLSLRDLYSWFRQMDACLSTLDAPLQRYMELGNRIVPILKIFKAWFIIQWFAFLATTLADLINVLKPLTAPTNDFINQRIEWYVYVLFHFLFYLLSFVIPFICGSMMNKLHHDYYQDLRRNIRQRPLGLLVSMEKEEDFDFIPGIHEIGLDIPISNQGYSMSIVLALIALVSSVVVANPDYWSVD